MRADFVIAAFDALGQVRLLLGSQQGHLADLPQVDLNGLSALDVFSFCGYDFFSPVCAIWWATYPDFS